VESGWHGRTKLDSVLPEGALANNDTAPVKLWRVETEKLTIQLGDVDKRMVKLAKLTGDKEELGNPATSIIRSNVNRC
jgi:hypothetical protein